jgi:hypothetical protein
MFVRVPLDAEIGIRLLIRSIEYVRRQEGEDVCLCFSFGSKTMEHLRRMNFRDKTFEVAAEGTD